MPTRATPVSVTGDELFTAITEGYDAMIALAPERALDLLDHLESALRKGTQHFPTLVVRHDEDEERDYLTLDGDDVQLVVIDTALRQTEAEDDLDEETVRFSYQGGTPDWTSLVYAVETDEGMHPVNLPDGWEERSL